MNNHVKFIGSIRYSGGSITTLNIMAVGRAAVHKFDARLLVENDGPVPYAKLS